MKPIRALRPEMPKERAGVAGVRASTVAAIAGRDSGMHTWQIRNVSTSVFQSRGYLMDEAREMCEAEWRKQSRRFVL